MLGGWIFWDFDGTLASRRAGWTDCLLSVLRRHHVGGHVTFEMLRPHMSRGFPWHAPDNTHHNLVDGDAWWDRLYRHFDEVLDSAGCVRAGRAQVFEDLRREYVDPSRFEIAAGVVETLDELSELGWQHLIVSNHVPELPEIVAGLGIADRFVQVISSALAGAEKPNREIFDLARRIAGDPETAWMVGDSLTADVGGALEVGLRPIYVGPPMSNCPCPSVTTIPAVIAIVSG